MKAMVRDALLAPAFLHDLLAGERPTMFKRLMGDPVRTSAVAAPAGRRPVRYDLYALPNRRDTPRPALVIAHGFTHDGPKDPRLQALAMSLARSGWLVMAPRFPQMQGYQLGLGDIDDLETALVALLQRPDVAGHRAGVLAFSFGVAPVLVGLTRDAIRERASFALVFGGCYDLRHALKYALTGAYDQAGLAGRVAHEVESDDRWKFLKGNVELIPDAPSRAQFLALIEARIADPACLAEPASWSAAERAVFALVDNREPDLFDPLYHVAAPYLDSWIRALSPATVAEHITTPLVIVHSDADHRTHYSESLALSRAIQSAPPPQLAIVSVFSHVDVTWRATSVRAFWRDVRPSVTKMWAVARRLMRERRRVTRRWCHGRRPCGSD